MDLLDQMTTFVRVHDAGSFSAAAKQLRRSVAAVSRQIAALEQELGVSLVRRTTRRMTVTDRGRVFYEHCQRVLREVELAQAVGASGGVSWPLRVSAPISYGLAFVAPRLPSFFVAHPRVALDVQLDDRAVDLAGEDYDVAIRVGIAAPQSTEVVAHTIGEHRRVVVAAPRYLSRRGTPKSIQELARHEVLAHGSDGERWRFESEDQKVETAIRPVFRSNALVLVQTLALAGVGVAYLPDWFVAPDVAAGRLRHVVRAWRSQPIHAYALHRRALRGEPRVRALIEHLAAKQ